MLRVCVKKRAYNYNGWHADETVGKPDDVKTRSHVAIPEKPRIASI